MCKLSTAQLSVALKLVALQAGTSKEVPLPRPIDVAKLDLEALRPLEREDDNLKLEVGSAPKVRTLCDLLPRTMKDVPVVKILQL